MGGYVPNFEELYAQAADYFCDLRKMTDGSWFAYSNILRKNTFEGDPDPYVRAPGSTPTFALLNLITAVEKERDTK